MTKLLTIEDVMERFGRHTMVPLSVMREALDSQYYTDDIATFLEYYRSSEPMDFIYDRLTGIFFINMNTGHETARRTLYEYHTGDFSLLTSQAADQYLLDGFGMFKSSVGWTVICGRQFELPTELKIALRRDIERM